MGKRNRDRNSDRKDKKKKRRSKKEKYKPLEFIKILDIQLDNYKKTPEKKEKPKSPKELEPLEFITIKKEPKTIDDLIELGKLYKFNSRIKYNIDIKKLNKLINPLTELKNMIGMNNIKNSIVDFIKFKIQDLSNNDEDMNHTVIFGPPGCGKTTVGKILGKIYLQMGLVSNDIFKIVKRSDLIGQYIGQTTMKTQRVFNECEGGVIFIDEVYSLGHKEGRDSFSKESIDIITQELERMKKNIVCIIAGYKKNIEECFFKVNQGLERRFNIRFTINKYSPDDLKKIFIKKIIDYGWSVEDNECSVKLFKDNYDLFKYSGGDMETLFSFTKKCHANRVFCMDKKYRKKIIQKDIDDAFEKFKLETDRKKNDDIPLFYFT